MKLNSETSITVMLLATLLVAWSTSLAGAAERKVTVSPSELPPAVKNAIHKTFPKGEILGIEKEVEGKDVGQFDFEIRSEGKEYEVEVSKEGKVIETKEKAISKKSSAENGKKWTKNFDIENCKFTSTGANRYFILKPGHQLVLENDEDKVIITVLDETMKVGDVETRVVEEREVEDSKLKEVSRNFFAICKKTGNVFYFGEEVDDYKNGEVVRHSGEWRADNKDSQAGIIMPGTILLGARHYQEIAPNALDRAEILSNDFTLKTPAGTFENCLRVEETSGLNAKEKCYKTYAPGIGLIQDEDLLLTKHSRGRK